MAQELEDGEFWLPPDFLTDDDDPLLYFEPDRLKTKASNDFKHGYASSFGFNSDLSSPVRSAVGSTETESDEDDLVASVTRKMFRSTFLDSDLLSDYSLKDWKLSSSPQSTLCANKRVSGANTASRFPLPPVAVSGKFSENHTMQGTTPLQSTNLFTLPPVPGPVYAAVRNSNATVFDYTSKLSVARAQLAYIQLQAIRFEKVKQFHTMELGFLGELGRTQGLQMASWSPLSHTQTQPPQPCRGSGMKPSFLGETSLSKGRTGTGVFLPRPYWPYPQETGYKQALIPETVAYTVKAQNQRRPVKK